MSKAQLKRELAGGKAYVIVAPITHPLRGVVRKAEKIQTNAVQWTGGSWLYFDDVKSHNITPDGKSFAMVTYGVTGEEVAIYEQVTE